MVAFLTLFNCRGVEEGKWVQNIFTVAKTLALILLIVVGLTFAANPTAIAANTQDLWNGAFHTESYEGLTKRLTGFNPMMLALMVAGGAGRLPLLRRRLEQHHLPRPAGEGQPHASLPQPQSWHRVGHPAFCWRTSPTRVLPIHGDAGLAKEAEKRSGRQALPTLAKSRAQLVERVRGRDLPARHRPRATIASARPLQLASPGFACRSWPSPS